MEGNRSACSAVRSSRERSRAILCIALANVIGGASYPAQKAALSGLPPATVTALRNGVALVALLVLAGRSLAGLRAWSRADLVRAFVLGTAAFALPMWLGIVGVERSSAANASILILLEPVTIVAIAAVLLRERIGRSKLIGVALGLAGALCILLEGASLRDLFGGRHFRGNALLALHGVLWGCYTPLAKPLVEKHDPVHLSLVTTVCAFAFLIPAALLESPRWQAGPDLASSLGWSVALGLFVSFLSIVLWLVALRYIPATSVAGFVFLQPLAGVLAGILLLGERLSATSLVGGLLVVAGVALDILVTARRDERVQETAGLSRVE